MRALFLAVVLCAATDTPSFGVPPRLQALLDDGAWDGTPLTFRIITLSHLADGCAGQARAKPARPWEESAE